ncbi:uncharacterized protein LOC116659627 [Camelus ferus]|uniref:Uncharacterized protein LOC116659627 n=1 Tax=Camelus ferus TaxID=419612 RepID=A0A8B8S0Q0_CAMFR|nr:uncharacterized protein LOC116659627 [Camelus ferus]XP_032323307.1 uncharacterized protein LOC116659627 [Camelus ferus]XP_032323308.1 uncharacterized protein LOC116659627 [Camelus ferus]XP_032323309.1 uncharacterized protein LOC116659627 [Camelus ferus]XP_032323310.1 uncharacterized protein LOC116659627 [Camelus ferus]XP_032323311.1 uncharacterized protein LOC116659627 [Camelus ferus]XP_032323312.1 uncharacterized protein LOC116659627 [Camelus ferus]
MGHPVLSQLQFVNISCWLDSGRRVGCAEGAVKFFGRGCYREGDSWGRRLPRKAFGFSPVSPSACSEGALGCLSFTGCTTPCELAPWRQARCTQVSLYGAGEGRLQRVRQRGAGSAQVRFGFLPCLPQPALEARSATPDSLGEVPRVGWLLGCWRSMANGRGRGRGQGSSRHGSRDGWGLPTETRVFPNVSPSACYTGAPCYRRFTCYTSPCIWLPGFRRGIARGRGPVRGRGACRHGISEGWGMPTEACIFLPLSPSAYCRGSHCYPRFTVYTSRYWLATSMLARFAQGAGSWEGAGRMQTG